MNVDESTAFQKKYGYKVSDFAVAFDALAVYVNKDNPIKCLTLEQVDRIFSTRRLGSGGRRIDTWGDAGLTGEWAAQPIVMYGRNEISGTYELFREQVLYNGEFRPEVKQQAGSEDVVSKVAGDKFAIGYSGIGYKTDGVRTVPLAVTLRSRMLRYVRRVDLHGQVSRRTISLYLFQQEAERADRPAAPRVYQIYFVQGRPGAN